MALGKHEINMDLKSVTLESMFYNDHVQCDLLFKSSQIYLKNKNKIYVSTHQI